MHNIKLFIEMLADNFKFILEGKGITEKLLRLLGFTVNFVVMTVLLLCGAFRGKK